VINLKFPECDDQQDYDNNLLFYNPECEADVKIHEKDYDPTKTYHGRKCKWLLSRGPCPKGLKPRQMENYLCQN